MKKLLALLLAVTLVLVLTGCDELDYRKAIDLYNRRNYDAAAEAFALLDGYEDSGRMITLSNYWAAIDLMEAGNFSGALPRFLKLGDYEDSAQRATECTYQMALAEFESGNFHEAQRRFEEVSDYKQSNEYLRRINWQTMFDSICALNRAVQTEQNGKTFQIFAPLDDQNAPRLVFSVEMSEQEDHLYNDFLTITLTRDSTVADFTCGSDFQMDYVDGTIGSSQSGSGRLDITTCTPETVLVLDAFEKAVTDNLGQTTFSTDPADSLMAEMLAENLSELLTVVPGLLLDAGITLTLNDIGFSALQ